MTNKNDMNLHQVLDQFSTTEKAITFLRDNGMLAKDAPKCDIVECKKLMTEVRRSELNDGVIWRCPKHKGRKKSIRSGSFLENQNIRLEIFLLIAYLWAYSTPVGVVQQWTKISNKTAIQWYQYLREICSVWLAANPVRLGGPGSVVQVDQNLTIREKNSKGQFTRHRCVFGMYDCYKNQGFYTFVDLVDSDTILPIMLRHILPGTEIHTDNSKPYLALSAVPVIPPYTHLRVRHTNEFVNPVTKVHTNNVQCLWKNAIRHKKMCGSSAAYLPSHLDDFMWRQLYGYKTIEAFQNLLQQISALYPV